MIHTTSTKACKSDISCELNHYIWSINYTIELNWVHIFYFNFYFNTSFKFDKHRYNHNSDIAGKWNRNLWNIWKWSEIYTQLSLFTKAIQQHSWCIYSAVLSRYFTGLTIVHWWSIIKWEGKFQWFSSKWHVNCKTRHFEYIVKHSERYANACILSLMGI